ncbi:MAG: hypothetical protein VB104_12550 [Candidatus Limiplasma sp.]|nr:hypothetical protein [Candidatus Limiplasma sp.]
MQRFRDWLRPNTQLSCLFLPILTAFFLNYAEIIKDLLLSHNIDIKLLPNGPILDAFVKFGNIAFVVLISILILIAFRKSNKDKVLNVGNFHHDHLYIGYYLCSKILGYRTCSIVRVPIAMQFKLLIRDTFSMFDYGLDTDYRVIEDENVKVDKPEGVYTNTINIVLSDTYIITEEMLPTTLSNLTTIYISHENANGAIRYFSIKFCESIQILVRNLPVNVTGINLFSTLNPKHCDWLARNVFKMASRSNIKSFTVFPQPHKNNEWNFSETGILVYKYR